jgi:flagellar hook protein FlgE
MTTVNIGNIGLSAASTDKITILGNLPSQDSGLTTPGAPFTTSSEYFTGLGASERVSLNWQATTTKNEWVVSVADTNGASLGSVTVLFNDSGSLAGSPLSYSNVTSSAVAPSAFAFDTATGKASLTLNNGTTPQVIEIDLGAPGTFGGITQFAGDFTQSFNRNGSNLGELMRTEIDETGTLFGVFDNGQRRPLFQIPVGTVANPNGLVELKGNAYALSGSTGSFFAAQGNTGSTGSVNSNALEGSNVDIAEEMTDLIKAQRAFSTNAKVITTVDDMMDETTRLKR